ncbi:uncharacterized protein METZ01_LOCUS287639 [marine metagenome]|uniref:Uncharacterized protein n=1 Tax=marine metagenome TaxID=408172 RepID=A0A382LFY9_9ZZZZ
MILNEQTLKQLSNEYIKGLAILSKMKEEGARPHDYLKHSIKFFKFKEYADNLLKKYEKGEQNDS